MITAIGTTATAQNLNSGYFNDGYLYRHEMNPAIGNGQAYVSMPAIGNVNVGLQSNIAFDDIFYNVNGRTATFLHPGISAAEFMSGVNSKNRIAQDAKIQIMGAGFKGCGGYNTIEVNVRENVSANIPGTLFSLAKEGISNKEYDIRDVKAHADAYVEVGLGHSHQVNDNLRLGAKLKMLLGVGNVDVNLKRANLTLAENGFSGNVEAEVQTSLKNFKYTEGKKMRGADGEETEHTYIDNVEMGKVGVNGLGFAVDLGAEYKPSRNWAFSAALLDLGYIGWNNNIVASTNGEQRINTNDYIFNLDENAVNSFDRQGDRLAEGLANMYELHNNGNRGSRSRALAATMNFGVQFTPGFYDKMNFGLMNSTRMAGCYSWTEFRFSANVSPTKAFSASATAAAGTYGMSFGWLLNVHPNGFNLFMGMNHLCGKIAKQGIPLSGKGDISMGVNFPF